MIHRWIEWKYVLPRAIVTAVVVLVVWLVAEPVLHGFLVNVGQRIVRAKVEIENVDLKLADCDLTITGVRVAHPRDSLRNLIECDVASFDVQTRSVLDRRLMVHEARLSGVRFNTPRTTSGKVDLPSLGSTHLPDEFETNLEALSKRALQQFARVMKRNLSEELVSIQLLQELAARWPEDVKKLEQRALAVQERITQLSDDVAATSVKPARAVLSIAERIEEVERLRNELVEIRHEMEHLVEQVGRDRVAIELAQRHDYATIKRRLEINPLKAENVSEYLLGEELNAQACELIAWIKLARRYWPGEVELPEGERSSGTDIVFPGLKPFPRALVQHMLLDGTFQRGKLTIPWQGEILNLTTDPTIVGKPMIVRVKTGGDRPLAMEATLNRTGDKPDDRIVISIPKLPQPQRTLGDPAEIALVVNQGEMLIWAELNLNGETLAGTVMVQQQNIHLTPSIGPDLPVGLQNGIAAALQNVNKLEAEVKLGGTLDKPSWRLVRSNLGEQAVGLDRALMDALAARQQAELVRLNEQLNQEQRKFDQLVTDHRQRLFEKIDLASQAVASARDTVAGRVQLPGGISLPPINLNPFNRR